MFCANDVQSSVSTGCEVGAEGHAEMNQRCNRLGREFFDQADDTKDL